MNYKMFVEDIPLTVKIGLFPEEREQSQIVLCSLEITVASDQQNNDLDNIENTVNYYEVTKFLQAEAALTNFKLLEPLAEMLLTKLLKFDHVLTAKIKLVKPKIMSGLGAKSCGIEMERSLV